MNGLTRAMAIAILAVVTWVTAASPSSAAQEPAMRSPADSEQSDTGKYELPEAEFVASPSFRSASLVQKIWGHIDFEGDYFGGNENNVGYTAGSWTFRGKGWELGSGFGMTFGDNGFRTMPALSIRWRYERGWFITEGLLVQGLLHTKFQ